MGNTHGRIVLLCPINAVRKGIVGDHPIKLSSRLIEVSTPVFTTIKRDLSAAVVTDDHALGVFRCDPKVVVVAVRRIAGAESTASVGRFVVTYVQYINDVVVLGIGINTGIVPGALAQVAVIVGFGPGIAAIIGTEHPPFGCFDDGPDALRIYGGNSYPNDAMWPFRQSFFADQIRPGITAIGTFPKAGAFATTVKAIRRTANPPGGCVQYPWVVGVDEQVNRASIGIGKKDALPVFTPVFAAVHAAFFTGFEQVAQYCGVDQIGIFGVNAHPRDVHGFFEANFLPGFAGILGFPHAVTVGYVAAHSFFPSTNINDVVVVFGNGYGAN